MRSQLGSLKKASVCEGQTLRDGKCRRPLIPQNVKTDAAIGVDIGVVDAGSKVDLRGLERVVGRERDAQEEDTRRVGRVGLRTKSAAVSGSMHRIA